MSEITKYSLKALFARKKILALSVISVSLCISLVAVIFGSVFSFEKSRDEYMERTYGSHCGMIRISSDDAFAVAESRDRFEGYLYRLGKISRKKSIFDGKLSLCAISESAMKSSPVRIVEGRMPSDANEIAVEKSFSEKIGVPAKIGDPVDIDIETLDGKISTYSFTVTGMIESCSSRGGTDDDGVNLWPSVIISEGRIADYPASECFAIYGDISADELENIARDTGSAVFANPRYSASSAVYTIEKSSQVILTLLAISTVLIAVVCIYSYFAVNAPAVKEQYKMLKLVGAGKKELFEFAISRTLAIYALSLVPGILLSILGNAAFARFVMKKFVPIYSPHMSVASALSASLPILLSIMVFGLPRLLKVINRKPLRTAEKASETTEHRIRSFDMFGKWRICSALDSKRVYAAIIAAMTLCHFTIFVGTMFTCTIKDEYEIKTHDDYSVNAYHGGYISLFKIPQLPYYGVNDNTLDELSATGEIRKISYIKRLGITVVSDPENQALHDCRKNDINETYAMYGGNFEKECADFGLDPRKRYYSFRLDEASDDLLSGLLDTKDKLGDPSPEELKDGSHVIMICTSFSNCPFEVGDRVDIFQILANEDGDISPENRGIFEARVTVSAVIKITENESNIGSKFFSGSSPRFVWGEGSFEKHGLKLCNTSVFFDLKDARSHEKTDELVLRIKDALPDAKVTSNVESNAEKEALLGSVTLAATYLAAFISISCMAAYVNITKNKYMSQRRLWGSLRAMGLKKSRVIISHTIETLIVFGASSAINFVMLRILFFLPIRRDVPMVSAPLLISYAAFAIIALAATLPIVTGIFKEPIVNQTNNIE